MYKRILTILSFIMIVNLISAQKNKYSDEYDLLNQIIESSDIKLLSKKCNNYYDRNNKAIDISDFRHDYNKAIDSTITFSELINQIDTNYINFQLSEKKHSRWKKKFIERKEIRFFRNFSFKSLFIEINELLNPLEDKVLKIAQYTVSIPIFLDKQKSYAYVYITSYRGPLAGNGGFVLYRKINGIWKPISYCNFWMS